MKLLINIIAMNLYNKKYDENKDEFRKDQEQ